MAESLEHPALFVEGESDLHTIIHLLRRHGLVLDKETGPVLIKNAGGVRRLLKSMRLATRASTNRAIGFVLDANGSVAARWQSVCEQLKDLGFTLPPEPPAGGFVDESSQFRTRVGIWIMPDNVTDAGALEDLVTTLVPPDDPLIDHAGSATAEASNRGAKFPSQDERKATLHCWLAWQKEPGLSFGTALKTHFFRHDSEAAQRFVTWFRSVFRVS